ncbi:polygalacturonase [Pyrus ussuriensis x Pyrus communis]|uniref:Polygalacturonase n=1 Tax=Pyrus ussuriensis x Pyrus communis TaxID=2448454 RepID=A0A5N5H7I8_9ROSA|nr:polygalacturonase [Pyrus ussuriensis x Pyrus communis]
MCILTLSILHHDIGNQTLIYVQEIIRYQSLDFQGKGNCYSPTALRLSNCSNLHLRGLTHVNSPRSHISIGNSENVTLTHLNITAPESSPNTDGIDLSSSKNVSIHESTIATGDDCIAIKGNCSKINITGIMCGPGHGISVGSLGAQGAFETVEEVFVGNCTLTGSMYGARIKTWQVAFGIGYGQNGTYNVFDFACGTPGSSQTLSIPQGKTYLLNPLRFLGPCKSNNVQIQAINMSDVTYTGFQGTSASEQAITLDCDSVGCTNIVMDLPVLKALCKNASGKSSSTTPVVPCLSE